MAKRKPSDSMEERLRTFGAKLDDLLAHARRIADQSRKVNLEEVLRQKKAVEEKLHELRGPAREAMQEVKAGVEGAWREIRRAASRAKGKFKKK